MRNTNTRTKTIKCKLNKCKTIFYSFSDLQHAYGLLLDSKETVAEIITNVKLKDFSLGDTYTTDFYIVNTDGTIAIRECVYKHLLMKPLTIKTLDESRTYWNSKGIEDWGIVINE